MLRTALSVAFASLLVGGCVRDATPKPAAPAPAAVASWAPRFDAAGALLPPTDYRTWTFLTSGFGMNYGPAAVDGIKQYDNVYVRPEVYDRFVATGVWPEHAMFVLEIRAPESEGSINSGGQFQTDLVGLEAEVKDSARYDGGWGFYGFDTDAFGPTGAAAVLPPDAACYGCHSASAAVENTFTQFYPTLYPIAQAKGTVRADFDGMPATQREVVAAAMTGGWAAADAVIGETARRWPGAAITAEAATNLIGYRLLAAGKPADAIAAFEAVTRRFPGSANAWDSLSEAYEGAARLDDARRATAEGLRVLPDDRALVGGRRDGVDKSLHDRSARLAGARP